MAFADGDKVALTRLEAFRKSLAALGWNEGANLRTDIRWGGSDPVRLVAQAKDLVAANPDVLLATTTPGVIATREATNTIPTVFVSVGADPVASGFVKSLSRPGGNMTGLILFEASISEKWLQLLTEIAPRLKRISVLFNPKTAPYAESYLRPIETVASRLGVKTVRAPVTSEAEIDKVITELGRTPNNGLLAMTDSFLLRHRKLIIALSAQHRVPTMYFAATFVDEGGLVGYGVDIAEQWGRSAGYVDRILRGAKPDDLPVQGPVKFEFAVNLKTAQALDLKVPQTILLRSDRVVE
jgi:putative ABC transport system substrate-binding protein